MFYRMADKSGTPIQIRLIEVIAAVLWTLSIGMLVVGTTSDPTGAGAEVSRWALLTGMLALGATCWAIGTWMVEVLRLEFELTRLHQVHPKRRLRSIEQEGENGSR